MRSARPPSRGWDHCRTRTRTMVPWKIWTFLQTAGFAARLMLPPAAAESSSPVNCSVTPLPSGLFRYQLSQLPRSSRCHTCWEDHDKTVIARDATFDRNLVQDLTDQSLTLNVCHDHLLYTRECFEILQETDCTVNCSLYAAQDPHSPAWLCFSNSWCPDELTGGFVIGVPVATVVLGLIIWFVAFKDRKRSSAASFLLRCASADRGGAGGD